MQVHVRAPEARPLEQHRRREDAVLGAHDLGCRVDLAQKGLDGVALLLRHEVALVEQQQVGKLELVAAQVRDGALVAVDFVPAAVDERVHGSELLED